MNATLTCGACSNGYTCGHCQFTNGQYGRPAITANPLNGTMGVDTSNACGHGATCGAWEVFITT